jgi:hypothetical protein
MTRRSRQPLLSSGYRYVYAVRRRIINTVHQELHVPATNQIKTLPLWVENIACHEAKRIYEMMPRTSGERAQVIARLEAGIADLLANEITTRAA